MRIRTPFGVALVALPFTAFAIACSGGGDSHPPSETVDSGPDVGADARAPDGSSTDTGTGAESAADGSPGSDAGADALPDALGPPPDAGPSRCDPRGQWSAGQLLPVSTTDPDVMGAITPDELTLAWMSGSAATGTVHFADRAATSSPFGASQTLAGSFALDKVALSPDGLRLVVVNADRKGFTELTRADRQSAFGSPGDGALARLNHYGSNFFQPGEAFASPVISPDDMTLYYTRSGVGRTNTAWFAVRSDTQPWVLGDSFTQAELVTAAGKRRVPTGISADSRTLFYFDESTSTEKAAFRPAVGWPFDKFVDLGPRSGAQPNGSCGAIYYAASQDLFEATAN